MQKSLAITALAAVMLFAPQVLLAQNNPEAQQRVSMREQVKHRLEESGFTNIQIVPQAFLVRATDPDGKPGCHDGQYRRSNGNVS
jgi:hypothetical protein